MVCGVHHPCVDELIDDALAVAAERHGVAQLPAVGLDGAERDKPARERGLADHLLRVDFPKAAHE